jgi:hypothetical protein
MAAVAGALYSITQNSRQETAVRREGMSNHRLEIVNIIMSSNERVKNNDKLG